MTFRAYVTAFYEHVPKVIKVLQFAKIKKMQLFASHNENTHTFCRYQNLFPQLELPDLQRNIYLKWRVIDHFRNGIHHRCRFEIVLHRVCLTDYDEFSASFSWVSSVVLSTTVNTGVRRRHPGDTEVENASLWLVNLKSLPVRMVDAVFPVNDVDVVVMW